MTELTRRDRNDLVRIAKMRGRIARSELEGRKTELLAEVERQLATQYDFGDNRWADLTEAAGRAVADANDRIQEAFVGAGIPVEFAPRLAMSWFDRGEIMWLERRNELRKVAQAELDAKAKAANLAIDRAEADVVTELLAATMADEAKGRLEAMPTAAELLIAPSVAELEAAAEFRRRSQRGRY